MNFKPQPLIPVQPFHLYCDSVAFQSCESILEATNDLLRELKDFNKTQPAGHQKLCRKHRETALQQLIEQAQYLQMALQISFNLPEDR